MEKVNDNFEQLYLETKIKKEFDGYYCFEDTVFYGEKGGMMADKGTINGLALTDMYFRDGEWYHRVDGKLSDPIIMEVDRETRYTNTAIQSLLHLLDGYYRPLGLSLIAVGVKPENSWYEIDTKELEADHLQKVQAYVDKAIRDDVAVEFCYVDPREYGDERYRELDVLRLVKFGDYDIQPCGTLHVNHTAQIGTAVILYSEKTSRGTRVYLSCGNGTRDCLQRTYSQLREAASLLGSSKEEIIAKISALNVNTKALAKENDDLKNKLWHYLAKEIATSSAKVAEVENLSAKELGFLANILLRQNPKNIFLLSEKEGTVSLAIVSDAGEARDIFRELSLRLEVRGGGSPKIVTANCSASLQEVKAVLENLQAQEL